MKKTSVMTIWIVSYLLMIGVPLFFFLIQFSLSKNMLAREIKEVNEGILSRICAETDHNLTNIIKASQQIQWEPRISRYLQSTNPDNPVQRYAQLEIKDYLRNLNGASNLISDIHLYCRHADGFLNHEYFLDRRLALEYELNSLDIAPFDWNELLAGKHRNLFLPVTHNSGPTGGGRSILFIHTLDHPLAEDNMGTVIIRVNSEIIRSSLNSLSLLQEKSGYLQIQDGKGRTILSSDNMPELNLTRYEPGDTVSFVSDKGEEKVYHLLRYKSDLTGWYFYSLIPREVYRYPLRYLQRMIFIFLLLALLASFIVAVALARKNYKPLARILNSINVETNGLHNEFDALSISIQNLFDSEQRLKDLIDNQQEDLKKNFLRKLTVGLLRGQANLEDQIENYHLNWHRDDAFCLAFFILPSSDQLDLARLILTERLEGKECALGDVSTFSVTDRRLCAVIHGPSGKNDIIKHVSALAETIRLETGQEIFAGLSKIRTGYTNLDICYTESRDACEYRWDLGEPGVSPIDRTTLDKLYGAGFRFPVEFELKLTNSIRAGDEEACLSVMNSLYDLNLTSQVTLRKVRGYKFNLVTAVINSLEGLPLLSEETRNEQLEELEILFDHRNMDEFHRAITDYLVCLCADIRLESQAWDRQKTEEIKSYVRTHFSDVNLGLPLIGKALGKNPAALSRLFKGETGETLVDYINRTRLEEAKKFLENPQLTVEQAAEASGFSSASVFIRTFRKFEGITPGRFKKMMVR